MVRPVLSVIGYSGPFFTQLRFGCCAFIPVIPPPAHDTLKKGPFPRAMLLCTGTQ